MKRGLLLFAAVGVFAFALAPAHSPAAAALDGGTLFKQRCASCHSVTPGVKGVIGPNLAGVVGRKAAAGEFNYTPALKGSKLTWSRANLDKFLAGPGQLVPGTRMVIKVSDPAERAAILDYLAKAGH